MLFWKEPKNGIDFAHLSAVARKHWQRCTIQEKTNYLNILVHYGLLGKLFTLTPTIDLFMRFEQLIYATTKQRLFVSPYVLFSQQKISLNDETLKHDEKSASNTTSPH